MAGRAAKSKEYRVQITSVKQWQKELQFDGLLVVEVFCSWFGPCLVIPPTIQSIMSTIDQPDDKVHWPVVTLPTLTILGLRTTHVVQYVQELVSEAAHLREAVGVQSINVDTCVQINIAKLEDDQRDILMEEEKKKQELSSVLRRKGGEADHSKDLHDGFAFEYTLQFVNCINKQRG